MTGPPAAAAEEPGTALDEGLAAFRARHLETAHRAFERAHRRDPRSKRAMSWYGVTLVLVERNSSLGVSLCDLALRSGPDPELLLNLARVNLALGQRERALRAVGRGLEAAPGDPSLLAALAALGVRQEPVLPFLGRDSLPNQLLGAWRRRWLRRHAPAYELSPVALGSPPPPPPTNPSTPPAPPASIGS